MVFVEVNENEPDQIRNNIGDMHPMDFSNHICSVFRDKNIIKFKRTGRKLVSIAFKTYEAANHFVNDRAGLPKGWVSYIPNYKIFRTAVVRGVDSKYSTQKNTIPWIINEA